MKAIPTIPIDELGALLRGKGRRRNQMGVMNKTEAAYARHLELRKAAGEIQDWKYEPFSIRLAVKTFYKPDFAVLNPDGFIEIHEVKGHMEDDAWVKLKVVAQTCWFRVFAVKRDNKGWSVTEVNPETTPNPDDAGESEA